MVRKTTFAVIGVRLLEQLKPAGPNYFSFMNEKGLVPRSSFLKSAVFKDQATQLGMHSIFLLLIIRVVHIAENVHGCTDHLHLHGNEVPRFPDLKSPELRGHECIMTHNPPSQILLLSRGFRGITHKWPLSCSMLYDIYPNQRHSQPCK